MGYAIAEELASLGAKVILVSGPVNISVNHTNIELKKVESAEEMFLDATAVFPGCDGAILAAAVADFSPELKELQKIKRDKSGWELNLVPTKDIAAYLGLLKKDSQVLAGFALETENELENARQKLLKKNLDFIVLNSLNSPGAGFNSDTNKITILDKYNNQQEFELKSKKEVASDIVEKMVSLIV
jgi:phosphopantothenoylcysteine decarboxylase / phosphopantothenate---cysteine ligase